MADTLALLLHSHLPYYVTDWAIPALERGKHDDHLSDAIIECYVPLGRMLEATCKDAHAAVTVSFSGPLLAQLSADVVRRRTIAVARQKSEAAFQDSEEFAACGEPLMAATARDYAVAYEQVASTLDAESPLAVYRRLAERGAVEIGASSLSHAYLPGLKAACGDRAVCEEVVDGLAFARRVWGLPITTFWLPECGYYPGLEGALRLAGASVTVLDVAALPWSRRESFGEFPNGVRAAVIDKRASAAFWTAPGSVPSHPDFREFHKWHPRSRLKYHRITDSGGSLDKKQPYDGSRTGKAIELQLRRFMGWVAEDVAPDRTMVLACDTELFGHWWHEGIAYLREMLVQSERFGVGLSAVGPSTLQRTAVPVYEMRRSSWGHMSDDRTWIGPHSTKYWSAVQAVRRLRARAKQKARAHHAKCEALLRVLLCSDWIFQLYCDRETSYAHDKIDWLTGLAHVQGAHVATLDVVATADRTQHESPDVTLDTDVEVIHVIQDVWPAWVSGVTRVLERLLEAEDAQGICHTVICQSDTSDTDASDAGVRRIAIPARREKLAGCDDDWVLQTQFIEDVAGALLGYRPRRRRVVVVDHINAGALWHSIARSRGWGSVFYCHGTARGTADAMGWTYRGPWGSTLIREAMRREGAACELADAVVAVSVGVQLELLTTHGRVRAVECIENAIRVVGPPLRRRPCTKAPLRILSLAGGEQRKNAEEFLRALERVPPGPWWSADVVRIPR